jgi:hypothetical protein
MQLGSQTVRSFCRAIPLTQPLESKYRHCMGRDSDATWRTVDMQNGQTPADQHAGRDVGRQRNLSRAAQDPFTQANYSRTRAIFSIVTVASSIRIPTANARPPSGMVFIVLPSKLRMIMELRIDHGIEIAIMIVLASFQST